MARRQISTAAINPVIPVVILLAIVGGLILLIGGRGSGSSSRPDVADIVTTTTTTTTTLPDPVAVAALEVGPGSEQAPASYRIVYEVTEVDVTREEIVIVNRPYESLVTSGDEGLTSGTATSRTQLWTYLPDQDGWLGVQGEAHRAAADHRPMPSMPAMVELGLAREVGTGEFVGRACRTYVTGQSLSASVVTPPAEDETTELCIDDAGLVLHERWQSSGDVLIERTAIEVVTDLDTSDVAFDPEPLIADAETYSQALGQPAVAASDAQLAALRTEIELPDGYTLDSAASRSGSGIAEVVRFYSSGIELIELAEVVFEDEARMAEGGAIPVTIDGFDNVWFAPSFRSSGLRMQISEVAYVEIRGTNPALLVELLRTMDVTD